MTLQKIQAALRSFGINQPQIKEIPSRAHQTWKVSSPKGAFILKQYHTRDVGPLQNTITLSERLSHVGIPIPPFIKNTISAPIVSLGDARYVLSPSIDCTPLVVPDISPFIIEQAALILGSIHRVNHKIYEDLLKKIDFAATTIAVTELLRQFQTQLPVLVRRHAEQSDKLRRLAAIIEATQPLRLKYSVPTFTSLFGCIHGDFTPDNLLVEQLSGKLFLIDWDNVKIAPRAFEIHKAIGAFCGITPHNAYLVPIDWEKAKNFLRAYHTVYPLTDEVINELMTCAAYGVSMYWLRFTLLQTLAEDFRMLDLLPDTIEDCLFWTYNLDKYHRLLLSLLS